MRSLLPALLAVTLGSCAAPTPSTPRPTAHPTESPTAVPTSTLAPIPSPSRGPTPAPSAAAFPTAAEVPLSEGRYSSSPPFGIDFTFEVIGDSWESGHLHAEFFDILELERPSRDPVRWIAWALPAMIRGVTDVPAEGLDPVTAAEELRARDDLSTTASEPFSFAGLDGVRFDIEAPATGAAIFGGPEGDFALDTAHDLRLGLVDHRGDLLLVLVLAHPGELEAAWLEALPVLESAALD